MIAATSSAISSGVSPPRANISSQERMSTALAWPAAGSIVMTVSTVATWFAAASTRADNGGFETMTARAPLFAKTCRWSSTVWVT